jgi:hypothetical protein
VLLGAWSEALRKQVLSLVMSLIRKIYSPFSNLLVLLTFWSRSKKKSRDIADTFRYHPATRPSLPDFEEKKKLPQQWAPFLLYVLLTELLSSSADVKQNTKVTFKELTTAMLTYLIRLTGNAAAAFSDFHKNHIVEFSKRL